MSNPYFPFFANDWLGSQKVLMMTQAERGAYIQLLAIAWNSQDCGLPIEDIRLESLAGGPVSDLVKSCFFKENERLYNQKLLNVKTKISEISEIRSEMGRKGGLAKAKAIGKQKLKQKPTIQNQNQKPNIKAKTITTLEGVSENMTPAFNDFMEMRKKIKKPVTDNAYKLLIKKLQTLSVDLYAAIKLRSLYCQSCSVHMETIGHPPYLFITECRAPSLKLTDLYWPTIIEAFLIAVIRFCIFVSPLWPHNSRKCLTRGNGVCADG